MSDSSEQQEWQSLGGKGIVNAEGERRLWAIECMDDLNADHQRVQTAIVHDDSGSVALCLRCGFVTWHEKDDEVQHEADCALAQLRAPAGG